MAATTDACVGEAAAGVVVTTVACGTCLELGWLEVFGTMTHCPALK